MTGLPETEAIHPCGERAIAVAREVGGVALAIDAQNDLAAVWYERFGALRLIDEPLKLILPDPRTLRRRHAAMFDTCFEYDDLLRPNGLWAGGEVRQPPETALTCIGRTAKSQLRTVLSGNQGTARRYSDP